MTRRDHESPADHARRIIAERRQREAEALRRANARVPFVDMAEAGSPRGATHRPSRPR